MLMAEGGLVLVLVLFWGEYAKIRPYKFSLSISVMALKFNIYLFCKILAEGKFLLYLISIL